MFNQQNQSTFRRWGIVIFLLVTIAILVFGIILLFDNDTKSSSLEFIPISLQSHFSEVNVSRSLPGQIAAMNMSIIEEVISDQLLLEDGGGVGLEEIINDLLTPVPTVTPMPTMTLTQQGVATSNPSQTSTAILSGTNLPTATNSPTINPSSSASPQPTASATDQPVIEPTSTVANTATISPTDTATVTPSFTPSNTPTIAPSITPSNTPTIIPSSTPLPTATFTPTPNLCSLVVFVDFTVKKNDVIWTITNESSQTILISEIYLDWPSDNEQLKKIKLGKKTIWDKQDQLPPTYISSDWKGGEKNREIKPGKTVDLIFEFDNNAALNDYLLVITLNDICVITAEE